MLILESRYEDRPRRDLGKWTSTYHRVSEETSLNMIDMTPLQRKWSKRVQTIIRKVAATATGWRSPWDRKELQENRALTEELENTPPTKEVFKKVEQ